MLSIGRLGVASGADYYLASIANSVDDYYLGRGEAPGQWIGATSQALGLRGVVDPGVLRNLLEGRGAVGEDLGIRTRSGPPSRIRPDILGPQGSLAPLGLWLARGA